MGASGYHISAVHSKWHEFCIPAVPNTSLVGHVKPTWGMLLKCIYIFFSCTDGIFFSNNHMKTASNPVDTDEQNSPIGWDQQYIASGMRFAYRQSQIQVSPTWGMLLKIFTFFSCTDGNYHLKITSDSIDVKGPSSLLMSHPWLDLIFKHWATVSSEISTYFQLVFALYRHLKFKNTYCVMDGNKF